MSQFIWSINIFILILQCILCNSNGKLLLIVGMDVSMKKISHLFIIHTTWWCKILLTENQHANNKLFNTNEIENCLSHMRTHSHDIHFRENGKSLWNTSWFLLLPCKWMEKCLCNNISLETMTILAIWRVSLYYTNFHWTLKHIHLLSLWLQGILLSNCRKIYKFLEEAMLFKSSTYDCTR